LTSIEGRLKDSSDLLGGRWRGVCRCGNIGHGGGMSSRGVPSSHLILLRLQKTIENFIRERS
jgi:hypothetical protein